MAKGKSTKKTSSQEGMEKEVVVVQDPATGEVERKGKMEVEENLVIFDKDGPKMDKATPSYENKQESLRKQLKEALELLDQALEENVSNKELEDLEQRVKVLKKRMEVMQELKNLEGLEKPKISAMNEISKEIKQSSKVPNNLPVFRSGRNGIEDPLEFIEHFERICKANQIQDKRYVALMALCVDSTDVQWIEKFSKENDVSWEVFQMAFIAHFQHPDIQSVLLGKIHKLKMDGDGVQRYSDRFIQLATRVGWNLNDRTAVYQFKKGLPNWLLCQLATAEATLHGEVSVEMLAKIALQIEVTDQQIQHQSRKYEMGS